MKVSSKIYHFCFNMSTISSLKFGYLDCIYKTIEYFSFPAAFDLDLTLIRPQSLPTWLWDIVNICSGHKLIELVDVSIPTRLDEVLIHLKQSKYQTIIMTLRCSSTWASEATGTTAMMVDIRQAHNRLLHFSENIHQTQILSRINIPKSSVPKLSVTTGFVKASE